jgi:hypothetical protein
VSQPNLISGPLRSATNRTRPLLSAKASGAAEERLSSLRDELAQQLDQMADATAGGSIDDDTLAAAMERLSGTLTVVAESGQVTRASDAVEDYLASLGAASALRAQRPRVLGSIASRSASPSRVKPSAVTAMQMPGRNASHGAIASSACA